MLKLDGRQHEGISSGVGLIHVINNALFKFWHQFKLFVQTGIILLLFLVFAMKEIIFSAGEGYVPASE